MYETYVRLRDERGMTDFEVAKETGIAQSTLSEWKTGKYTPKADKMIALARFFGVTLDELMVPNNESK